MDSICENIVEESTDVKTEDYRHIKVRKVFLYGFFKRLFDFFGSLFLILLLSWLLIIIALLVKCTSKGPIFYVSKRVGKNGKEFRCFKFRSMVVDADKKLEALLSQNESEGGVTFKMKDDPRITKFGKFLRKTSLDELPQLFNIFNGTMTFVGPRPGTPREYALYNDYQKQRLLVKQGLTGYWQTHGRSNTTFDEMVEMDLLYIEKKRGFFYDLGLMFRTVWVVLKHDGAE